MAKDRGDDSRLWVAIRAMLRWKPDLQPLPVFDEEGRSIERDRIWWVDEHHQLQWKPYEGPREDPVIVKDVEYEDFDEEYLKQEWGEAPMVEPIRSTGLEEGQGDDSGHSQNLFPRSQVVWWEDVEEAAKLVANTEAGRRWVKAAWEILIHSGAATFSTELERCRVLQRFVALGFLYHTGRSLVEDHPICSLDEYEVEWWTKTLGLTPFRVGCLAGLGNLAVPGTSAHSTEFELTTQAIPRLAEQVRQEIVTTLQGNLGGPDGLRASFFRSLLKDFGKTGRPEQLGSKPQHLADTIETWVQQGCPLSSSLLM